MAGGGNEPATDTGLAQAHSRLRVPTRGRGLVELTRQVGDWVREIGASDGLLTLYVRHTSASLTIQENADPDVGRDLLTALDRLAPEDEAYRHSVEGPDDMPAHIKSMLTSTSLGVPVLGGAPVLGTWQGIFLIEHRSAPHAREVVLHYIGTLARG